MVVFQPSDVEICTAQDSSTLGWVTASITPQSLDSDGNRREGYTEHGAEGHGVTRSSVIGQNPFTGVGTTGDTGQHEPPDHYVGPKPAVDPFVHAP